MLRVQDAPQPALGFQKPALYNPDIIPVVWQPWTMTAEPNSAAVLFDFEAAFAKPMCVASELQMHAVRGGGGQRKGKERRKRRKV